jgi:hypothetical protein
MKKSKALFYAFIASVATLLLFIFMTVHGQTDSANELNTPPLVSGGLVAKIATYAGIVWEVLANVIPTKKNFSIIGNILSWLSKGGFRQPK